MLEVGLILNVVTVIVALCVCVYLQGCSSDAAAIHCHPPAPKDDAVTGVTIAPLQGPSKEPWDKALGHGLCLGPERSAISVQERAAPARGGEHVAPLAAGQDEDGVIPALGESLLHLHSSLFHP